MSINAGELSNLLETKESNYYAKVENEEIGRVISVGYGIARVYGLQKIQAGEMVEFSNGIQGMALDM